MNRRSKVRRTSSLNLIPAPGLQVAFSESRLDEKSGLVSYNVEVAIPLTSIGLARPAGKSVGFDLSVGVSNAPGDRRERAGHWAGLSEGVVVDRPGSARLLPSTWGTVTFVAPK